jgi:stage II sporulation protein AA (anti-sigma F factor antagonist)
MHAESQQRWLEIEPEGEVTVVRLLCHELVRDADINTVGKRLLRVVQELGCRRVALDFRDVERVESAMIGKILALHKTARELGGRVALCGVNPLLAETLETLHLTRFLDVYPGPREAVQALRTGL